MTTEEKRRAMDTLQKEVFALSASPLYAYRIENNYLPVVGEGSLDAQIVFVGEAPGKNEALSGRPFCGAAGKVLDAALAGINLERSEIYITNIVKDRPPKNRDPLPEEIAAYGPFLDQQIEIIKPTVIVPLGRYAMGYIMQKFDLNAEPIGAAHGKAYAAKAAYGPIHIIPQYHPAATIYNRSLIDTLAHDFKTILNFL